MNKYYLLLLILFFTTFKLYSQDREYLIYLKDKKGSELSVFEDFSQKNQLRHIKFKIPYDKDDFPVSDDYLEKLNEKGEIISNSKWLNAVHYKSSNIEAVRSFGFIQEIIPLNYKTEKRKAIAEIQIDSVDYGSTYFQNDELGTIKCLHDNNYLGQGILIAVLDAGFPRLDSITSFQHLFNDNRVVDTFDFEDNQKRVFHKSGHGTLVSSLIAGYQPQSYIGGAPEADYAFYVTEIAGVEINLEEYNLVRGLERADSIGADIVNISLGYLMFDSLQNSYTFSDLDGRTTVTSKGVQIAARKGIVVMVAAGNSGPNPQTISSPCDADSILCVGATKWNKDSIALFSSLGPTADNRMKPDISAIGQDAVLINTDGSIFTGNGTSFATPLCTGMIASLMQANPNLNNIQIIEAVKQSAHLYPMGNNTFGYGTPNACKADSILTILSVDELLRENKQVIWLYPNPSSDKIFVQSTLNIKAVVIYDNLGQLVYQERNIQSNQFENDNLESGIYFFQVLLENNQTFVLKSIIQ